MLLIYNDDSRILKRSKECRPRSDDYIQFAVFCSLKLIKALWKKALVDIWTVLIFAVIFLCSVFFRISPVIYVVAAAALGILLQLKKIRAASKKEEK